MYEIDRTQLGNKENEPVLTSAKNRIEVNSRKYRDECIVSIVPYDKYVYALPFVIDQEDNLKYVFTSRVKDLLDNSMYTTLGMCEQDGNLDETPLDAVKRYLRSTLMVSVPEKENERIFYLGELQQNRILKMSVPCYAVDVSGKIKPDDVAFKVKDYEYLTRRRYTEVMGSGSNDPVLYAALYLLMTYYN